MRQSVAHHISYAKGVYSEAAVRTSSTTSSMSKAFSFGKGRTNPSSSRTGLSLPSILMTKEPLLGFSSLIFTVNACSVLASRAALTIRALFLNAFHDLQCSIETTTELESRLVLVFLDEVVFLAGAFLVFKATVGGSSTFESNASATFLLVLLVLLVETDI
mmetsp:Transcript_8461/g.15941  ORF Transcript_8461/g.15941 Transcript_8461/m.15941 type:complete len:161 (+) Transcript_8461:245-727(+)